MRVRDHVLVSTAAAALASPWLGRRVLAPWAASILIDVDHYAWFVVRKRRFNPMAAVRFFGRPSPHPHRGARLLHSPVVLFGAAAMGLRWRALLPVALGMSLHAVLDLRHESRVRLATADALRREDFTCQRCGARGAHVTAHTMRQPWLLPSYQTHNLVALCHACHAAAHQRLARNRRARKHSSQIAARA
jgi:5-methylcytosine-specific restriction endonuclease McrA